MLRRQRMSVTFLLVQRTCTIIFAPPPHPIRLGHDDVDVVYPAVSFEVSVAECGSPEQLRLRTVGETCHHSRMPAGTLHCWDALEHYDVCSNFTRTTYVKQNM